MPVTDFFRNAQKPQPHPKLYEIVTPKPPEPEEIVSDKDIEKLNKLVTCIYQIRQEAKEKREKYFDNYTLLNFVDELVLMIDDISRKKSIKDYIAHPPSGPQMELSTRVIYPD